MLFNQYVEPLFVTGGSRIATLANISTAGQTVSFTVPRTRSSRRLEAIQLIMDLTAVGAATTNCENAPGLLERVSLNINDGQSREWCAFSGGDLYQLNREQFKGRADHWTMANGTARGEAGTLPTLQASDNPKVSLWLLPRDPMWNEQAGNLFSIPMDKLTGDAAVVVKVRDSDAVWGTNPPTAGTLRAIAYYRDVPADLPYISTEWKPQTFLCDSSNAEKAFRFAGDGWLVKSLIRGLSSGTYANTLASVALTGATDEIQLKRGSEVLATFYEDALSARNQLFTGSVPALFQTTVTYSTAVWSNAGGAENPWHRHGISLNFIEDVLAQNPMFANSAARFFLDNRSDTELRLQFSAFANTAYIGQAQSLIIRSGQQFGNSGPLELLNANRI